MNPKLKLSLYAVLVIAAGTFGALFYSSYRAANNAAESAATNAAPAFNEPAVTNADTNLLSDSNRVVGELATNTNAPAATTTNTNVATNAVALTSEPEREPFRVQTAMPSNPESRGHSSMIGYFVAFLGISILLGLLIARDISEYFAGRSVEFMFNEEGTGIKNPEYEEAEKEWANGNHLEAIRLMRDYLGKNPREQGVALRIAEIYEKDLKNNLAAALEYEEVLKHKLPPERWGWAAIHLCNLYSKMDKTNEAVALLRRIDSEYGETAAAKKARERLATFDPTVTEEIPESDATPSIPTKRAKSEENPAPESNLPPGFRPKK